MKRLLIFLILSFSSLYAESSLSYANKYYENAEKSSTVQEREKGFNQSLEYYLKLAKEYPPNKDLYFNIANNYFQLNEFGLSILYYYKALQLAPRNSQIIQNLEIVQQKAGVEKSHLGSFIDKIFYFHSEFLQNEKVVFVTLLSVIAALFCSFWIWFRKKILLSLTLIILIPALFFGTSLVYSSLFPSIEAILIKPSLIKIDSGDEYASVSSSLVLPGEKVRVLELSEDKTWVKIKAQNKTVGFVPNEVLGLIQ